MTNCNCEKCLKHKNPTDISWFKENTAKIAEIYEKFFDDESFFIKNIENKSIFRITIAEFNEKERFMREYSRIIDNFEFSMLMDEFFNIDNEENTSNDDDYPVFGEDIRVFKSIDEVIEFLQQRNEEDE